MELPVPGDSKSLRRVLGFFSHYSQWIQRYSEKIRPLTQALTFPVSEEAKSAFTSLKNDIKQAVVHAIDEDFPFEVETDASDFAIAATLSQKGRPVAFFSRTLQGPEVNHASVEKEAKAIIEAVRHWRHYLTGRHSLIITDQCSIAYMFDCKQRCKIKNEKIMRWRTELSCYSFDIVYRPGSENIPADTLSRAFCAAVLQSLSDLARLHNSLCHPGITRMYHFVKNRNLPFSIEDIRQVNKSCRTCAEVKPQFHSPTPAHLIKATQPFERLNMDYKGPLKSTNQYIYFLNVVDEYSRFPFVFPCKDVSTQSVIRCLCELFSVFGMPAYVHSDRGSSFMSDELHQFLLSRGVASSRTTPYNPAGNGQVERYNGIVWKAIVMALRTRGLPTAHWQEVLPDALHSIRSLLCTATNSTPHERLFSFERRSSAGRSVPTWLMSPGPVLLKRHVRSSKSDLLVDEVQLLHANPQYAYVRHSDGRESTVSIRHLAPIGRIAEPSSQDDPPSGGQSGEPADQSGREPMMAHSPITSHNTTEVTCPTDDRTTTTDPAVTSTDLFSPPTIPPIASQDTPDADVPRTPPITIDSQPVRRSQRYCQPPDYYRPL